MISAPKLRDSGTKRERTDRRSTSGRSRRKGSFSRTALPSLKRVRSVPLDSLIDPGLNDRLEEAPLGNAPDARLGKVWRQPREHPDHDELLPIRARLEDVAGPRAQQGVVELLVELGEEDLALLELEPGLLRDLLKRQAVVADAEHGLVRHGNGGTAELCELEAVVVEPVRREVMGERVLAERLAAEALEALLHPGEP